MTHAEAADSRARDLANKYGWPIGVKREHHVVMPKKGIYVYWLDLSKLTEMHRTLLVQFVDREKVDGWNKAA